MPKVSKETATRGGEEGPVVDHSDDIGGYTVNFHAGHAGRLSTSAHAR
jgi:hypothetical protein